MTGQREVTSTVNTSVRVTARDIVFGHAWERDGCIYATVRLGYEAGITLESVAHAEALIAAATQARDALAALEASAPPATAEERADYEAWRSARATAAGEGGQS